MCAELWVQSIGVALGRRHGGTGMRLDAVVFAESLVKVQLLPADRHVHAAVVEGGDRVDRERDVVWKRERDHDKVLVNRAFLNKLIMDNNKLINYYG